jgi:hypothetical protein
MKLKEFPLVMRAFREIELDSGGFLARALNPEVEVPEYWEVPFRAAEEVFIRCGGRWVVDVSELFGKEEYNHNTPLWQVVAIPVNEDDKVVYRALGIGRLDGWVTSHLLGQFFDGELAGKFTTERKPL